MGADNIIQTALDTVGVPVARAHLRTAKGAAKPKAYLTYRLIYSAGALHADDDSEVDESTWRVSLFSREDYTETIRAVVRALKAADFYGVTVEAEQYEDDTGYYHISIGAKYLIMEE